MSTIPTRSGGARARSLPSPHHADNTVHALILISNDLGRHITDDLRRRGYHDRRSSFAPLFARIWDEGVPQGRLAEELGISMQAASQTVSLAEQAGYVTREPNPRDGRSKLVSLSDLGRRFVGHGAEAIAHRSAQYADLVGVPRLTRFEATLTRLQTALGLNADATMVTAIEPRSAMITTKLLAERATRELRSLLVDGGHGAVRAAQTAILVQIGPDGSRASEMARAQRVSRQAVSSTLHEVEALGYLSRRHDADDARGVVFVPTERGRGLLDDYAAGIEVIEGQYEAVLGSTRFAQFADTARDLRHRLRLESTLRGSPREPAQGTEASPSFRESELLDLATDLHHWLGDTDTIRLGAVLNQLAIEGGRTAERPAPTAPRRSGRTARTGGS